MVELEVVIKEFVAESGEMLDHLEQDLMILERHPSSPETLASLFRSLHTIKGAAGFMGLAKLGALAHSGESVLSRLREGTLTIRPEIATALLALSDCLRTMLARVDRTGEEGDADGSAIVAQLARLQDEPQIQPAAPLPPAAAPLDANQPAPAPASVRVSVEQLRALMNLVSELVIARNGIRQLSALESDLPLRQASQRLDAITTQLQEGIMKTRLQPIGDVWSKLSRIVRDAAHQCGKRVRLEMDGKDTELDRTLIEAIQGPLAHVVRNCVDHGLETPAQRLVAGKPPEGRLALRAFHEGGQVTIDVSDDGAGIDLAAIRRKACDRGLITPEQARGMSDQDAINLIFLPGLSTAAAVTTLSGRGVGMDVVKTNIEQIGGKVSIRSEPGVGTTVSMRIPLTLAIMTALIAASGDQRYAIPQVSVDELVRLEDDEAAARIEMVAGTAACRLRGDLLPLVWLNEQLNHGWAPAALPAAANMVVLHADGCRFGLIVDAIHDAHEVVVKPLGRQLRGAAMFAGATIMGDGQVVLILDVLALAVHAAVSERRDAQGHHAAAPVIAEPMESLLLIADAGDARMAIPISQITRLEDFAQSSVERAGGRQAVPYLGGILPLEDIAGLMPASDGADRQPLHATPARVHTLVYSKGGRQIGVVVDRILDTIAEPVARLRPGSGAAASLLIDGHVTRILDLDALCARAIALPVHGPAAMVA